MAKRLSPTDGMFLVGETREVMFHVAGLMQFTPPPDAPRDYLRGLMDEVRAGLAAHYPWNVRLRTPNLLSNPTQSWIDADDLDLTYHVRRSALPSPGDERELGILVSRLHGGPVDFHHPPWECHLIEGLEGGRFAMYIKVHHSLVDGFSAMRLLQLALTHDPADRDRPLFFAVPPPARGPKADPDAMRIAEVLGAVREQFGATKLVARALAKVRRGEADLVSPSQAPKCVLNARIGRNRRFATAKLPLARIKALAKAGGATINDIVLALSSAALRKYLAERDALPRESLIAMLPVAVRAKDDVGGGNSVGAILATLATDVEDPAARLAAIVSSTKMAKRQLEGMSRNQILSYSALLLAPAMFQMMPGIAGRLKPGFNVVISNVPGPDQPLYFRGARLESTYPMSIPVHGQALNITCNSYAGQMCFGFTGCRDTVPHLQRMAVACTESLEAYERAVGI